MLENITVLETQWQFKPVLENNTGYSQVCLHIKLSNTRDKPYAKQILINRSSTVLNNLAILINISNVILARLSYLNLY